MELLKAIVPKLERVAVLSSVETPAQRDAMESAARSLGLKLQTLTARRVEDLDGTFRAAANGHSEALIVLASALFTAHHRRVVDLAAQHRLVTVYEHRDFVGAGGLMSYGPNFEGLYRSAARYVDKILKGAKPADLPIEQPTQLELVINMKTAKALGLNIPPVLRLRADRVIE
jgi:putative ABC transport system substrate-binding protein